MPVLQSTWPHRATDRREHRHRWAEIVSHPIVAAIIDILVGPDSGVRGANDRRTLHCR
jgi:hypothetical protein